MIKLSQRDSENVKKEELKPGMILVFHDNLPSMQHYNGSEFEVVKDQSGIGIEDNRVRVKVIKSEDKDYLILDDIMTIFLKFLYEKKHRPSPVNMTGRYRTIGD